MTIRSDPPSALNPLPEERIAPVDSRKRPLVSVMIPTYQPTHQLSAALRSVLQQDMGDDRMQIAVIDDASPNVDIDALAAATGFPGRVEIHRMPKNEGLSGNWNRCIRAARGEIVHILHQDDRVETGFYARMLPALTTNTNLGMAFCRHAYIDAGDRVTYRSHRERLRAGVLRHWLQRIAEKQRIQCASVLVPRKVYEQLGGYRSGLCYALDWEMWVRIASRYDVWYEPRMLAYYRQHDQSETHRLLDSNRVSNDILRTIETFGEYLPAKQQARLLSLAYAKFVRRALKQLDAIEPTKIKSAAELLEPVNTAIARMPLLQRRAKQYRLHSLALMRKWRSGS
jgi:GT2 family glycosyltransferase